MGSQVPMGLGPQPLPGAQPCPGRGCGPSRERGTQLAPRCLLLHLGRRRGEAGAGAGQVRGRCGGAHGRHNQSALLTDPNGASSARQVRVRSGGSGFTARREQREGHSAGHTGCGRAWGGGAPTGPCPPKQFLELEPAGEGGMATTSSLTRKWRFLKFETWRRFLRTKALRGTEVTRPAGAPVWVG